MEAKFIDGSVVSQDYLGRFQRLMDGANEAEQYYSLDELEMSSVSRLDCGNPHCGLCNLTHDYKNCIACNGRPFL